MSFSRGHGPLAVVTDQRLKIDAQLDEHEPARGTHVLDTYRAGAEALGRDWHTAGKFALFEYKQEGVGAKDRVRAKAELLTWLRERDAKVTCVLPTPNMDDDGGTQDADTVCWTAFGAPDSLDNMRGTFYEWEEGRYVIPLFPRSPFLKQLQLWQQTQWFKRALDVAAGEAKLLTCPQKFTVPDMSMVVALEGIHARGLPVAVDIESIEESGTVTAIGVSDGYVSCAVPWESYVAYGRGERERALGEYEWGEWCERHLRNLLAANTPKIFHNWTFDVPRLREKGFEVGGPIHDTMAAHAIAYPELRHGLQHACASLLNIRPWKSVYHPKLPGVTRDDIEYWIADPVALLDYNADDAFHTIELARAVLPQVEQDIFK